MNPASDANKEMPTDDEEAFTFSVEGDYLCAVLHRPSKSAVRGVVLVVGGPQYRVGSHRQFVLLGRDLAAAGVPVLRFDYRGMGDSEGEACGFEHVDSDIRAAIDALTARLPDVKEVVLWGLCDAASACVFYGHTDPRVRGLVLLNPWVRTGQGIARAYLTGYYAGRVLDPELWRKLFSGRLDVRAALRSFASMVLGAFGASTDSGTLGVDTIPQPRVVGEREAGMSLPSPQPSPVDGEGGLPEGSSRGAKPAGASRRALPERVADGLSHFRGRVLLILSGRDLTAEEFQQTVSRSRRWRRLLASPLVSKRTLPEADHTFSRRVWRDQVSGWTTEWLRSW